VRYTGLIFILLVPYTAWHFLSDRPVSHSPGVLVEDDPKQVEIRSARTIEHEGAQLQPHATFVARARVLSRERYRIGKMAEVAPLDIAVGWGRMSDTDVLQGLDISQSNRFYFWHYDDEPPIPIDEIVKHSANWHLIPANSLVWRTLDGLREGDVVSLEGKLVDVETSEEGLIRTSLTRDDAGPGACEIILVESAYREPR